MGGGGASGFVGVAVVLNSNVYNDSHTVAKERPPWVLFVSAMSKKPFKRFRESSFNLLISWFSGPWYRSG